MSSEFVFSAQSDQNLQATKKPPDPHQASSPKISFRDKLLGPTQETLIREREDMIEKKLVRIEHENGNRLLPKVHLEPSVFQELCTPWKDAIVVKLLGKNLGYHAMRERLQKTWRTQGGFEIMDNDNGFFMVKFDEAADKEKVVTGGPWLIYDHCLAVAHWTPEFASPNAKVDKTIVWVRFPGLNLVYYDESFLLAMASALGRPIKVDTNTLKIERGKFARVCVEIDLTMPIVGKIWVNGHWYKVQYEGLHLICTNCGCYGHLGRNCTSKPERSNIAAPPPHSADANNQGSSQQTQKPGPTSIEPQSIQEIQNGKEVTNGKAVTNFTMESLANNDKIIGIDDEINELHGEWLLVTRKKRFPKNPTPLAAKNTSSKNNRFNALNTMTDKNKTGPPNQTTQPRPFTFDQPRASQTLKETKRRRQDHEAVKEHTLQYNPTSTPLQILTSHKTTTKTANVARNITSIPNDLTTTTNLHKHVPPEKNTPIHEQQNNHNTFNTSPTNQAVLEPSNLTTIQNREPTETVHEDTIVTDHHASQDANEVDMVT